MSIIVGVKWVTKIKVGPPHICCLPCEASHRMGKCFAPNAVRRSHDLRGTKRPLVRMLYRLTNIAGITSKSKCTVKCPDLPSAMRLSYTVNSCLYQSLQNLNFSDDNSDSDEEYLTARRGKC